jgi:hypothetical protein
LPARIGAIAYQNKAVIYDLLFKASSQTMLTIAADPKRLGVKIGFTEVVPGFGTRGLSGGAGCSVMVDGADDEENETEVRCRREGEDSA